MEFKLKIIVLISGILFTGLTAGICFTWTNAVTSGLAKLDDITFLKSFQAMNRAILNKSFFVVFFSPVFLLFINAFLQRNSNSISVWFFIMAATLFIVGVGFTTVFKNVPLNEMLDKTVLENASNLELKTLRTQFEKPWVKWHNIRTVNSFLAFVMLLIGLIYNK